MTEFTTEQLLDQRHIGRQMAWMGYERPPRSVCLYSADLKYMFGACGIEPTPLMQEALEAPSTNIMVYSRMFKGFTKPEVLQRETKVLYALLQAILEPVTSVQEGESND